MWRKVLEIDAKWLNQQGKTYNGFEYFEYSSDIYALGKYATNPTDLLGNCLDQPNCDPSYGDIIVVGIPRFKVLVRLIHASNGGNCIDLWGNGVVNFSFYKKQGDQYVRIDNPQYPFGCSNDTCVGMISFNNQSNTIQILDLIMEVNGRHVEISTNTGEKISFDLPEEPVGFSLDICMGSGYGFASIYSSEGMVSNEIKADLKAYLSENQFFTGFQKIIVEVYDPFEDLFSLAFTLMSVMMMFSIISALFSFIF